MTSAEKMSRIAYFKTYWKGEKHELNKKKSSGYHIDNRKVEYLLDADTFPKYLFFICSNCLNKMLHPLQ